MTLFHHFYHQPRVCLIVGVLMLATSSGCASMMSRSSASDSETIKTEMKSLKSGVEKTRDEGRETLETVGQLKAEVQSVDSQVACLRHHVATLRRAARSGILEERANRIRTAAGQDMELPVVDDDLCLGENSIDFPETQTLSPLVPSVGGRSLRERQNEGEKHASNAPRVSIEPKDTPDGLLADAALRLARGNFGEAIVLVSELHKKYPSFEDRGASLLILAEAWMKLAEYENAFPVLRNFYLKYPKSDDLLRAKLIEAQAHEGVSARERAALLYREIISLEPQSSQAQFSRRALQRLRDGR